MGLLQYVLQNFSRLQQNNDGLLKKAEYFLQSDICNFEKIARKYTLDKLALFVKDGNNFFISYSYGFNKESITKSFSTCDFWNGTVNTDKWNVYEKEDLIPFLQLLSSDDKFNIEKIYIKRINNESIIFIPEYIYRHFVQLNLQLIEDDILAFLEKDFIDDNIRKGLDISSKASLFTVTCNFDLNTLYNFINQTIFDYDLCIFSKDIIRIVLFSEDEIDLELYKFQLVKTLKEMNPDFRNIDLQFEYAGCCTSIQGIKAFINQV